MNLLTILAVLGGIVIVLYAIAPILDALTGAGQLRGRVASAK